MNHFRKPISARQSALLWAVIIGLLMAFAFLQSAKAMSNAQDAPEGPDAILANLEIATVVDTPRDNNLVQPGGLLTYTIRFTNTTGSAISNVTISDTLSGGQSFDGTYSSNPNIPINQYTQTGPLSMQWVLPTLGPNASGSIVFHTTVFTSPEPVASKPPRFLGNTVKIFSDQGGITGSQDDTVAVLAGPILELEKVVGPNPVLPGHILAYTITLSNLVRADSIPATQVLITDTLPTNTTFLDAGEGGAYDEETNLITWHLSDPLGPGQSVTVHFRAIVSPSAASGSSITNRKSAYRASSIEIKLSDVLGKRDANVRVAALLQKVAVAVDMNGSIPEVFPTEEVTYTITVYNPFNEPLNGVVVTDTLPGDPDPFVYVRPANGSPAPDQIFNDGRDLAWLVDLPAWGSITRSFVVSIPRNTVINQNATYKDYYNDLDAFHPTFDFGPENSLARVRVKAALIMSKIVSENNPQPGITIYYTITLENRAPFPVTSIRLTDTIAGPTHYLFMSDGPNPLPEYNYNPIVWQPISVGVGESREIAFAAFADGVWLSKYCNNLNAYSPDAFIPNRTNLACIIIDPPMRISKTVEPNEVYPGAEVEYTVGLYNMSLLDDVFTLVEIEDYLPSGFYQVGGTNGNPASIPVNPPYPIGPGETWEGSFIARVTSDIGCNNLPKTYWNAKGNVDQHYITPIDFWATNASNLAPLVVNPHVLADLIPYRRTVRPGEFVTYTLNLVNQSPDTLSNVLMEITLPSDTYYTITYIEMVQGPQPAVDGQILTWDGISLPGNSTTDFIFLVQVVPDPDNPNPPPRRTLKPLFTSTASNGCVGKLGTGDDPLGLGTVIVDPYPVALVKTARTDWVPPVSDVDFDLQINNKDAYPFTINTIIDTMPPGFTYDSMLIGPDPTVTPGSQQLVWNNVTLPAGTTSWRIRLRSAELYGEYINYFSAIDDELIIETVQSKPVSVVPSVSIIKRAAVEHGYPGSIVPYTITLINLSETLFTDVTITDTLPSGFTYLQMTPGGNYPPPTSLGVGNTQPVWTGLTLPKGCGNNGCTVVLAFQAMIDFGVPEGTYYNMVAATSPNGSIPNLGPSAPISVTVGLAGPNVIYLPLLLR